jgi:hypothetical protein
VIFIQLLLVDNQECRSSAFLVDKQECPSSAFSLFCVPLSLPVDNSKSVFIRDRTRSPEASKLFLEDRKSRCCTPITT